MTVRKVRPGSLAYPPYFPTGEGLLARHFDDPANDYLEAVGTPVSGPPLSLACWFNTDDATVSQTLVSIGAPTGDHAIRLAAAGHAPDDPIRMQSRAAGWAQAESTTGYSLNTWHHAAGVLFADNDRAAYIDGGSKGTDNGDQTPTVDTARISRWHPADNRGISGSIALPAIWNVALSDAEVLWLARGGWPGDCRPGNLVFFAPLFSAAVTGDADFSSTPKYNMKPFNSPTWAEGPPRMDALYLRKHAMGV